jgi:hypothetical protein
MSKFPKEQRWHSKAVGDDGDRKGRPAPRATIESGMRVVHKLERNPDLHEEKPRTTSEWIRRDCVRPG